MFFVENATSDNKLLSEILELKLDDGKSVSINLIGKIKQQINLKVSANNDQQKPFASYEAPKALSTDEKRELFSCLYAMSHELFANESESTFHSDFDSAQSLRFIVLENYILSKTQKEIESQGSTIAGFGVGVNLRA